MPKEVDRRGERIQADNRSTEDKRTFLTANLSPCSHGSPGFLPSQKNLESCSQRLPFDCAIALSSTCCRLSERPGYIVLTFQLARRKIGNFVFLFWPRAEYTVCWLAFALVQSIHELGVATVARCVTYGSDTSGFVLITRDTPEGIARANG